MSETTTKASDFLSKSQDVPTKILEKKIVFIIQGTLNKNSTMPQIQ